MCESLAVTVAGDSAVSLLQASEDMDMQPNEYLVLCLNVCEQLPKSLLFAIACGIPVSFYASAYVGEGGPDGE